MNTGQCLESGVLFPLLVDPKSELRVLTLKATFHRKGSGYNDVGNLALLLLLCRKYSSKVQ